MAVLRITKKIFYGYMDLSTAIGKFSDESES